MKTKPVKRVSKASSTKGIFYLLLLLFATIWPKASKMLGKPKNSTCLQKILDGDFFDSIGECKLRYLRMIQLLMGYKSN